MGEGAQTSRDIAIPAAIRRARDLIEEDPSAPLTLAELADACGLSHFQFLRAFTRATGLTPHAYLLQRRIHEARRLIASGTPLAEAAFASGFADQSHMTRLFVRNFGISPGAYAAAVC
ncbi:AraC family transcriptional regulator [Rhizobium sp. ICMP 5592]|uniref:AraC family transcriptional regulator n=1 Tax=Rhizobium sp. ICMP 5592 TaxID=2292445 RepID=UPI003369F416